MFMQNARQRGEFHEHELVMWHYHDGKHHIPIPGVVVRQEPQWVVIRARFEGAIKEVRVDPEQLVAR